MNRLLAIIITGFWIVMWGLLLRGQFQPQDAALMKVPVEHVMKLFFHHQQQSDLFLRGEGGRIGHFRIHPQIRKEDGQRLIEFSGNVQIQMLGGSKQRFGWDGIAALSPIYDLERLRLRTSAREASTPPALENTAAIDFDGTSREVAYEVKLGGETVDKHRFTADQAGLKELLKRSGVDTQILQFANISGEGSAPVISARRANFKMKEDKVDTLLLTIQMNGQTLLEFHVSQLGQILHAKTLTGWTLQTE